MVTLFRGHLSPAKSLLNPAGTPTFWKHVLLVHLVIMIQLVPGKNTHKDMIQLLQCWVNTIESLSFINKDFSAKFLKIQTNQQFINDCLPCTFCSVYRSSVHPNAMLTLICLFGIPSITRVGYSFFPARWHCFLCCFLFMEKRRQSFVLKFIVIFVNINWC